MPGANLTTIAQEPEIATQAQSDLVAAKAELTATEERLRGAEDRAHHSALVQTGEPLVEICFAVRHAAHC